MSRELPVEGDIVQWLQVILFLLLVFFGTSLITILSGAQKFLVQLKRRGVNLGVSMAATPASFFRSPHFCLVFLDGLLLEIYHSEMMVNQIIRWFVFSNVLLLLLIKKSTSVTYIQLSTVRELRFVVSLQLQMLEHYLLLAGVSMGRWVFPGFWDSLLHGLYFYAFHAIFLSPFPLSFKLVELNEWLYNMIASISPSWTSQVYLLPECGDLAVRVCWFFSMKRKERKGKERRGGLY